MEAQYHTLVSETSGRECSIEADLVRASPLVTEAGKLMEAGKPIPALDLYSNAIKVHIYIYMPMIVCVRMSVCPWVCFVVAVGVLVFFLTLFCNS